MVGQHCLPFCRLSFTLVSCVETPQSDVVPLFLFLLMSPLCWWYQWIPGCRNLGGPLLPFSHTVHRWVIREDVEGGFRTAWGVRMRVWFLVTSEHDRVRTAVSRDRSLGLWEFVRMDVKGPLGNEVEIESSLLLSLSHGIRIQNLWVIGWGKSRPLREREPIPRKSG